MQGQVQCLYGRHCSPLSFSLDSSTAIVSSSSLDAPCGKNSSAIHKQLQRHKKNKGLRACHPSPSNTVVSKRCLDSKKRALHRWVSLVLWFSAQHGRQCPTEWVLLLSDTFKNMSVCQKESSLMRIFQSSPPWLFKLLITDSCFRRAQ